MEMSVKFELCIRELSQSDADQGKILLPESHEYAMYLDALIDDLRSVPVIVASERSGNSIVIEMQTPFEAKDLKEMIKPYFSNEKFNQYRFVSLLPKT